MKYNFRLKESEDERFKILMEKAQKLNLMKEYTITSLVKAGLISLEREMIKIEKERKEQYDKHQLFLKSQKNA
jgi:hypothetical protein